MFIFGYISILLPPTVLAQTTTSPTPAATIPAALLQIFDGVTVPPVQVLHLPLPHSSLNSLISLGNRRTQRLQ